MFFDRSALFHGKKLLKFAVFIAFFSACISFCRMHYCQCVWGRVVCIWHYWVYTSRCVVPKQKTFLFKIYLSDLVNVDRMTTVR